MANPKDQVGEHLSQAVRQPRNILVEKILRRLNLSRIDHLKSVQTAYEQNLTDLNTLRARVDSLTQIKLNLEHLKFELTSRWIDLYKQTNPRPSSSSRRGDSASATPQECAQQIRELLKSETLPLDILSVLSLLPETYDNVYRYKLRPLYEQRLIGENPEFWDVRMAVSVISRILQPRTYLEIGTRVGWSLSQLLAYSPQTEVFSFDMWIEGYGGMDNPGADFVRKMMGRITTPFEPRLHFLYGNSHDTLPQFFNPDRYPSDLQIPASKPTEFDLITVDGDHNLEGAWMDLTAVMPHIAVGGSIIFDDIDFSLTNSDIGVHSETSYPDFYQPMPQGLQSLRDVWNAVKKLYPNFIYIDGGDQPLAVGIGIRVS